jgi:type II secretory pathway component PulC
MTKREKIIVVAAAVAVLAGIFNFLAAPGKKAANSAASADLKVDEDFASSIDAALKKAAFTKTEAYVFQKASIDWASDPFAGSRLVSSAAAVPQAGGGPALDYTGYVIARQARLAVINGMEYSVGEMVLGTHCVVKAVEPKNVIVVEPGKREGISIPFSGNALREVHPPGGR